jgi:hypothetical protein
LRLREILVGVCLVHLACLALTVQADEPSIVENLALISIKSDRATLYYEKNAPGDAAAALKAYEALLAELTNRSVIGDRADRMLDQIDALVGFVPASDQRTEQRRLLEGIAKLTKFMPKRLCIVRQSTIKDLLQRGEGFGEADRRD